MISILFIDDEKYLLEGLKRIFRGKAGEWDMSFAENAGHAIELIGNRKFDIVITDCQMPGMSGLELLTRVREISPDTIRILMSGHLESELPADKKLTHQGFIAKPFEAETLISMLEEYTRKK